MLSDPLAPTVSALLRTLLAPTDPGPHADRLTSEMLHRLAGMPRYMGFGVSALTLMFDALSVGRTGRRFHQLDAPARASLVRLWRKAPGGKDMIDFYEKMGTFVFYSIVEEAEGHA